MGYIQIGNYWYPVETIAIGLIVAVVAVFGVIKLIEAIDRPPPRKKTPEELDQEAGRLRAETRLFDAQAENAVARAAYENAKKFIGGRK